MPKTSKIIIILFGAGIILAITFVFFPRPAPKIDTANIAESSTIHYSAEYNLRQTINDCGPFNVAAVVRALTNEEVSSADFAKDIKWRLRNKYTLPWGLEKQLKENGIEIELPNLHIISDDEKISYLKEQLSLKHPIIVLGNQDGYQHYITLFGFNSAQETFYTYDSMYDKEREGYTKDSNDEMPGNKNVTEKELLDFWSGGGMYGIYKWYSIVASTPTESRSED